MELFIKDLEKLEQIKGLLENNQQICIWFGSCLFDRLMLARIFGYCGPITENISLVPVSEHSFSNFYGEQFVPKTMIILSEENILNLKSAERPITQDEIKKSIKLWERVSTSDATLRLLNNNSVEFVEEDYFDTVLMGRCTNEFTKPARVVGETLIETDFVVSDPILNWRLKTLVRKNRLEAKGILREMRDYEVRIPR